MEIFRDFTLSVDKLIKSYKDEIDENLQIAKELIKHNNELFQNELKSIMEIENNLDDEITIFNRNMSSCTSADKFAGLHNDICGKLEKYQKSLDINAIYMKILTKYYVIKKPICDFVKDPRLNILNVEKFQFIENIEILAIISQNNDITKLLFDSVYSDTEFYFNKLELRIYNPSRLSFNEIFKDIKIKLNDCLVNTLYNSEYLDAYDILFKSGNIIYDDINKYTYIPLTFMSEKYVIPLKNQYSIEYTLQESIKDISPILLARKYINTNHVHNTYVNNTYVNIGENCMDIYQNQLKNKTFYSSSNCNELQLNFYGEIYAMFIVCDDISNIESFTLIMNNDIIIFEISPESLTKLNKKLGFPEFKYPLFVFNNYLYFNCIPKKILKIKYKKQSEIELIYEFCIIARNLVWPGDNSIILYYAT
jgi:hypothetical protein